MEWGVGVRTYVERDCRKELHSSSALHKMQVRTLLDYIGLRRKANLITTFTNSLQLTLVYIRSSRLCHPTIKMQHELQRWSLLNIPRKKKITTLRVVLTGIFKGFLLKSGIPGHFGAKKRYIFKTRYKSHVRSPAIGQRHIVPAFGFKRPWYTWFRLLCLAFNRFWRILSQSEATH